MAHGLKVDMVEADVRVLTLSRAGKANALDASLVEGLLNWIQCSEDDDCRVLVIAAEGGAFCGGFDFTGYENASHGDLLLRFLRIEEMLQKLRHASFVSIALIQGAAIGAGADLAASCTYRVGTTSCRFAFPGFRFGVALGTRHLSTIIGQQKARDILLSGDTMHAKEAFETGLLTQVVEAENLTKQAIILANESSMLEPLAMRRILALTSRQSGDDDLSELVRSVSAPGLHGRIARYRESYPGRLTREGEMAVPGRLRAARVTGT